MPGQLANLVRSKYPGAYDDMPDDELERSVLAKYPEYSDLVESKETKPKKDVTKFVNTETAKPEDFTKMPSFASRFWEGITEPYDWAKPIVEHHVNKVPEGPGREMMRENLGGFFSPLSIGSEAAAGIGIIGGISKYLGKGRLPEVAASTIEEIPRGVPSNVNMRPIRGLLPETTPRPGFISGEAGTAINRPQLYDIGPVSPKISAGMEQGTVLPRELEGISAIEPSIPASGMVPPKLPEPVPTPAEIKSMPSFPERIPTGEISRPGYYGTGLARPGEPQVASAPVVLRKSVERIETPPVASAIETKIKSNIKTGLESEGVSPNIANTAADVMRNVPELAPIIQDTSFIKRFLTKWTSRETSTSRFAAKLGSSIDTELTTQHPMLGEIVKQTQVDSHIKAGTWINRYDKVVESLNEKEFNNFVRSIENKEQPINDKVTSALSEYRILDKEISDEAINSGMGLRSKDGTKMVPWQPHENYWPHLYTEEFFKSLRNNPTELRAKLTEAGMAPLEIDSVLKNARQFGERLIDAQHAREINMPGYRIDKNVYRQHITDMAKRITEAKNYGPMDLADNESPLMNLVNSSKNPEYSTELMKKLLNRGERADFDSLDVSRKVTALQAWLHLSTAGISNLNTTVMVPIATNTKSFVKGLADMIFRSAEAGEFAKESGALQNIFKEIFAAEINESAFMPTKVYGIDAGERFMRTLSSSAGKSYAKQLFNEVKSGGSSEFNLKRLQELTLTNVDDLMLQPELTIQQLKRAAFRSAELTQGLAEQQHLPKYWTDSGLANILTLFHKYQFTQTKIVKDLIMSDPIRTIPMLLGASQIAGELTGDAKALIRGLIKSGISGEEKVSSEIEERGKFIKSKFGLQDSPELARFIENMGQSFALGIYADVLESMAGGGTDVLKSMAGSALNDLMDMIDMGKNIAKGNFEAATRKGVSKIPFFGPSISQEMKSDPYNP
jgi:hypothetical protein